MLLLPNAQVLFAAQTGDIYAYTYLGCPDAAARPQITAAPTIVRPFLSHTLHGRVLNGLSQAVGYGDDASAATNYPIVRIRHRASDTVTYCRTSDHSTMGVGTGATVQSTSFHAPLGTPAGPSDLFVVANGVASEPVTVEVRPFWFDWPVFAEDAYRLLIGSLADGPLWAHGPNGPVPVDPWGPKQAKKVTTARKKILEGVGALRVIGADLAQVRDQTVAGEPHAPDDPHGPVDT